MQYTLRNIPEQVDKALRDKARRERRSINQVAIDVMARALGIKEGPAKQRDLADIAGSGKFDSAMREEHARQRQIDDDLW